MSHKRRWWDNDERFKKVQDNLRKNYDNAIGRMGLQMEKELEAEKRKVRQEAESQVLWVKQELKKEQKMAARLAKEIADYRMLLMPRDSRPFTMRAEFSIDDRFLYNARDLKEIGPYIVERLCHQIQIEFSKIDWARPTEYRSMFDSYEKRYPRVTPRMDYEA